MTLEISRHEIVLKQILKDIFKHDELQGQLAFKGGTCLYIFYELNRFSTDLDFNVVSDTLNVDAVSEIINKYLNVEDYYSKRNTWFWLGSYEKGYQKVKVEISKREYPDEYKISDFLGISVKTMKPEFMFAHKLCAITDRARLQNRDLFDSWFMFEKDWSPTEEIIELRTGKSVQQYYGDLVKFIKNEVNRNRILDGLGEVLDEKLKFWVKQNLVDELLFQLGVRSKGL